MINLPSGPFGIFLLTSAAERCFAVRSDRHADHAFTLGILWFTDPSPEARKELRKQQDLDCRRQDRHDRRYRQSRQYPHMNDFYEANNLVTFRKEH